MNSSEDAGIETSLDMNWVASLEKRLPDTNFRDRNREPTIYRIPDILKRVDRRAYEPSLISLGPYHRNKPRVQAMNKLKWKYLRFVLDQNLGVALVDYVDRIKKLETRARDAYSEEVKMSSNSFVEMMLLDGCFVMLTIMEWNTAMEISDESTLWTRAEVLEDIFMLENQLPFFLLESLYEAAFPLGALVAPFRHQTFKFIRMHTSTNLEFPSDNETFHHIIHLFLSCIDPTRNYGKDHFWIPSATVLNKAGIHFEIKKKAKSFLDITFHKGKLQIPKLQIDYNTNSLLRNLIAYEQCSMRSEFHVSSYAKLMDYIINTAEDVELLQKDEIIISGLGDSQVVATLFNKLPMHVAVQWNDKTYLFKAIKAMLEQSNTKYSKWRIMLNRNYFGNPWAIISLFGALVLFVLTVIQTIYAIMSYIPSRN
ncbi:UPF0481 protein At3g47200-like [Curcuma longa]|uniref:UPF0481 protein At3g47200-like n=1 Tax=Curcuma longa TaxID=136217 RepID=UPI003D9F9B71